MQKRSKIRDRNGGQAAFKRRSKLSGLMITQFEVQLPEGKATPDFERKLTPLNLHEGKLAVFKAVVKGVPRPKVTWKRATGNLSDSDKFHTKYNEASGECSLEIRKVSPEDKDTYKCFAANHYGRVVCTAKLNVIEVTFKRQKATAERELTSTDPADFRRMLKKTGALGQEEQKPTKRVRGQGDRFWEVMMSADREDYERICAEFGVADLGSALETMEEKRQERLEEQAKYVESITNVKHVEVLGERSASFGFDLELKDPTSRLFLFKDGVEIPYSDGASHKHSLKVVGKKHVFSINDLKPGDAGLYQVDVEEVNLFSTEFRIPIVDFVVKIEEVKAQERQDALFECVLTHPVAKIKWMGNDSLLENGEKYCITVSEDKLIHRLLITNCEQLDKGIYAAVAGIKSCRAWLVVEVEHDAEPGTKKARKTTAAGGTRVDLEKVAKEQQAKIQEERKKMEAAAKVQKEELMIGKASPRTDSSADRTRVNGLGGDGAEGDRPEAAMSEKTQSKDGGRINETAKDDSNMSNVSTVSSGGGVAKKGVELTNGMENEKSSKARQVDPSGAKASPGPQKPSLLNGDADQIAQAGAESGSGVGRTGKSADLNIQDGTKNSSGLKTQTVTGKSADLNIQDGTKNSSGLKTQTVTGKSADLNIPDGTKNSSDLKTQTVTGKSADLNIPDGTKNSSGLKTQTVTDSNEGLREGEDSTVSAKHQPSKGKGNETQDAVIDGNELSDSEGHNDSPESSKTPVSTKRDQKKKIPIAEAESEHDEAEDPTGTAMPVKRKRQVQLVEDSVIDPGVHFVSGLSDVDAVIGGTAEITCKLSSEDCEGAWFRDGNKISADGDFVITKEGAAHKLTINNCQEEHSGKYRFEADGRKTEAVISVKDPPRFDPADLSAFMEPVEIKVGHNAIFKLPFIGLRPIKIQWFKEGEEFIEDANVKVEKSETHSRLLLIKCQRKDTGEIKIKLKNPHGITEAISQLYVLDKPTAPQGPAEVLESSAMCIVFKWRPPKDDGGTPVVNYVLERQQMGRNTWKKLGEVPGVPSYRDTDVDHGRKYCYRIWALTAMGLSEMMETDEIQAGTLAFPGPPAPPNVLGATGDHIMLSWDPPPNTGNSRILGYYLEKRKKGSNLWSAVDELVKEKKCAVRDVVEGIEYEFRVAAVNLSGAGEFSSPSEFVFARDPQKPPGKVMDLKVADTSYSHMTLVWTKPEKKPGVQDEASGYFVEIREGENAEWSRCNTTPFILTSFPVKGLRPMEMYWVQVIATNDGGEGAPNELDRFVLAMPSPVRPRFTDRKMKSFMVVRAGNSVRITINFEASPRPEVHWLKDNGPVTKRVTVGKSDGSSQLLIPSSKRSDSGVYSILVKNMVGQETYSVEVRVTDDPKPPGLVELEENVPGTVTVMWAPSPDEKRDDRLHYVVSKLDSSKGTWSTVADRLFNNKSTVCNIMPGREYHFRVYAKNDMGMSAPSDSPTWGTEKKKEKFVVRMPTKKQCDLRCAPTFIVPLKLHIAPKGYECYMSCAVKGNPKPRITWYRNSVSLNTNTNYHISNTCGVCSMLILHVGLKDMGEYSITAENDQGRAKCSTILSVRE